MRGRINGANRLGGNSLSDLLVFGKRAGDHAAAFASRHGPVRIDVAAVDDAARVALEPFARSVSSDGEGPYQVQQQLQETMQDLVGIVRNEADMQRALRVVQQLSRRAAQVAVPGNREYNPGWHTALDLPNMLTVSEAIARAAIERKESRGAQFREDYPDKNPEYGTFNIVVRKGADGQMELSRRAIAPLPAELAQIIEEMR
jgi:Succinate dehydrogenase/fumarate reductase, flavoprotein subunit